MTPRPRPFRDLAFAMALGVAVIAVLPLGAWRRPALFAAPAASTRAPRHSVTYSGRAMGTYVRIVLVTPDSTATAPLASDALGSFHRVDSLMSNWTTTSEVARLNREAGDGATPVDPEVARVIAAALRIGAASAGAFDITVEPLVRLWGFLGGKPHVPEETEVRAAFAHVGAAKLDFDAASPRLRFTAPGVRIDLGGIAKGYAVDVAAESLRARGVTDALVDISGNMMALGRPAAAEHWRIGIRDPRDRMPYFARLHLTQQAIATSGTYEQFVAANGQTYGHILDPRTGRPADGLISVTVVAGTAMDADAWGTALFVLGPAAAKRMAKARDDVDAVLVQPGSTGVDTVWVESTLGDRFAIEPAARAQFRVVRF